MGAESIGLPVVDPRKYVTIKLNKALGNRLFGGQEKELKPTGVNGRKIKTMGLLLFDTPKKKSHF